MSVETQTNHRARLEKVREKLAELKLQALIIFSRANIRYLTGFTGSAALASKFKTGENEAMFPP